mmetsp:Transcript_47338/g.78367  ORF Transcript_47338/g.78367 Transcript_47338/m.78367 type:complete len:88 (-) Transcript_47338:9-272(-)
MHAHTLSHLIGGEHGGGKHYIVEASMASEHVASVWTHKNVHDQPKHATSDTPFSNAATHSTLKRKEPSNGAELDSACYGQHSLISEN